MIVIQGYIKVAPDNVGKLKELVGPLVSATRQEAGNIAYAFAEDLGEPGLVHIIERWADDDALDAHNKTPHLAAFMGGMAGLAPTGVRVARYDAESEKVLFGG
jgi:quinol monooxygenase YgiN